MLRKLAALLLVALSMAIAPLMPSAHAGIYAPKLPTTTTISVVTAKAGQPLVFKLTIKASDGTRPNGTATYAITRAGAAGGQLVVARSTSGSVAVNHGSATVTGQVAQKDVTYVINARFSPTNTAKYLPSSGVNRVTVGSSNGGGNPGGGSTSGLPNTGGPDFAWVLAGFALLVAGAGAIAYAGRRQPQAA